MAYPLHREPHRDGAPGVTPNPSFPAIEEEVLAHWEQDGTFQASIDQRPAGENGDNEFVFYDGPPFANGLPHYGHLLTGYVKDVVPRYQTMRGRRVERRFGWDTHGLPAELEAERILGITDKSQIESMGIEKFNAACRESVLKYTAEWREYVTRQARWVDFDNDYKTLDLTFMESVIWAFKQLYDKGLAYEGYRVLPYCWRDETPLSNHELRMDDDVYQSRQDPAVTIGVRIGAERLDGSPAGDLAGALLLMWTTTPWTLPSNLAAAVGPDIEYALVEPGPESSLAGRRVLLGAARVSAYERELGAQPRVLATYRGADLAGLVYGPPFDYFAGHERAFQVLVADYVTTEDGTGIVHQAPAFGEDDMAVCQAAGIAPVMPVDGRGRFTAQVPDYEGDQVFDANPKIVRDLKDATGPLARIPEDARALLVRHETYQHSYPHCWRCRNPLIYRAVSSWFVKVSAFRDRMVELNEQIDWTPDHVKEGQFGKWLAGARDWSVSRNRFWGSPIPVWKSDDPAYPRIDVYGSVAELERDFGVRVTDLHRPYIDELTRPNPDDPTGRSTMRRIPDIFDVWFDSGSMPYAQVHYPFENRDWFEHHYPGDFIVEYVGQTRGWFYLLHVLATALFDRPAFRSAISHGIVLGDDGRKMSKSLRNYPDVNHVFANYGSDAMRWFLMASPVVRGANLIVTENGIRDTVRQVLLPLWSTYYFFTLYANASAGGGYTARRADGADGLAPMDRYLLARTNLLVEGVTEQLDAYDIAGACGTVEEYLDVLTNWYVRTQRDRFWVEDHAAFDTLYTALTTLCEVMAPLAPLLTEEIWRGLTGGRSVHLRDWPQPLPGAADPALVAAVDKVREVVSATLGLRKAHSLRVRQPLARLTVVAPDSLALGPYADLLCRELNVKQILLTDEDSEAADGYGVAQRLTVNARAAGPRLGRAVQGVIRAAKVGAWRIDDGVVVVETDDGDVRLAEGEYELATVVVERGDAEDVAAAVLPGGGFVVLDLALTDELISEGYARDVIRDVQDERKAAGLDVADRIRLRLSIPGQWVRATDDHRELIARETLAVDVAIETSPTEARQVRVEKVAG